MAAPITWKNVNIDNGSSAAAFGSNAANFGRSAVQGLDIFSQQMGDRISREDELLTNEAIAAALSGGPQVADNRRVDANALQVAVERNKLGVREERALESDLLSSAVDRRLNTASAGIKEKDLATYDERFELDKQIAQSEADYRETQSEVARANLEDLRRQRAEAEKDKQAFAAINNELFGPQVRQNAIAEHEAYWKANAPLGATAEDKARDQAQWLETAQQEVFNNPRVIQELALKYDTSPLKVYQGTAIGQRALAAQSAADAVLAERAALSQEQQKTYLENAQLYGSGNDSYVRFDSDKQDYVFEKDTPATDATFSSAFIDVGVKPDSEEAKKFKAKIQSRFKSGSVSEQIIKELVRDGKIPKDYSRMVDDRADELRQRAKDAENQTELTGSTDKRINSQNFYRSIESRTPKETSSDEAATALQDNPLVSGATISSITTTPQTEAERDQARDSLKVAVDGLLKVRDEVKLPADASNELRALYNRFRSQVDVANGGAFVPEQPTIGIYDVGVSARPVTPRFGDRKEFAVDATATLQQLQTMLENEKKQKEADKLRRSLD